MTRLGLAKRHSLISGLRNLLCRLKIGPPIAPLELAKVYLNRNMDVHLSDTYSNPNEHLYSFAELVALAENTGWSLVALAEGAGLPTRPEDHTRDAEALSVLKELKPSDLYDYFAFHYQALGFTYFLRACS
jgi:hypothetical protein